MAIKRKLFSCPFNFLHIIKNLGRFQKYYVHGLYCKLKRCFRELYVQVTSLPVFCINKNCKF
jgi:hypothetical protein